MKKRKRLLAVVLCMVILTALPGCQSKKAIPPAGTGEPAMSDGGEDTNVKNTPASGQQEIGGYVEEDIEMPPISSDSGEGILKVFMGRDQSWKVYTAVSEYTQEGPTWKEFNCYSKPFQDAGQEEADWKKEPISWIEKAVNSSKKEKNMQMTQLAISEGEDGKDYLFVQYQHVRKEVDEEGGYTFFVPDDPQKDQLVVYRRDAETGEVDSIKLKGEISNFILLENAAVMENGNIVLGAGQRGIAFIYSGKNGKLLNTVDFGMSRIYGEYGSNNTIDLITSGNRLVGRGPEGIAVYNESGKLENTIPYKFPENSDIFFSEGRNGGFLVGDNKGLHHNGGSGTLWETAIEGFQTSYALSSDCNLRSIYLLGEKEDVFAAVLYDEQKDTRYKLVRYVYDKEKPAVNRTLTVYSLYYNDSIQEYINRYQIKHKDIRMEYIVGKEEDGSPDADYIRAFNTELINGKGPDIIVLDGLPADSYVEKEVLSDISALVKPLADSGKLLSNIVSPYIGEDGKMYRVPMQFRLPWATGEKDAIACLGSAEKVAEYIKKGEGTAFTEKMSYEALSSLMLGLEYSTLIQGTEPDSGKIKGFLESLKTVAENTGSVEHPDFEERVLRDRKSGAGFDVDITKGEIQTTKDLLEGKIKLMVPPTRHLLNASTSLYLEKNEGMEFEIMNHSFIPSQFIGIYKESKEKEQAEDFLRYILEEEPEEYLESCDEAHVDKVWFYHWGYISVYAKVSEVQSSGKYHMERVMEANGKQYKIKADPEAYKALLEEIKALDQPMEVDQEVFDMVVEGAVSCLAGRVTAEQAANDICNKIRLYQAERE